MRPLFLLAVVLLLAALPGSNGEARSPGAAPTAPVVSRVTIDGAIGPATTDYVTRALAAGEQAGHGAFVIQLDTPGGLDAATRDINRAILAAAVPVIGYVAPQGARAASAGTYILYATHVAAMAPATNLGAATPVPIGGAPGAPGPAAPTDPAGEADSDGAPADAVDAEDGADDGAQDAPDAKPDGTDGAERPRPRGWAVAPDGAPAASQAPGETPASASDRKAVNDAAAYLRSLAELRGRNAEWAEEAVREAASLTASEALEQNVVDLLAPSLAELLTAVDGRTVTLAGGEVTLRTAGARVVDVEPDWRNRILGYVSSPTVAYLLFLIGLYGLLLEGYNPGVLVPGIVGAISLILALYAFQVLPINYAGVALIVLGVILIVAEAFAPSFGALGIGGIVALVVGSVILIDGPGLQVPRALIGSIAAAAGVGLLAVTVALVSLRNRRPVTGRDALVGSEGVVLAAFDGRGRIHVQGEDWQARAPGPLAAGQRVRVVDVDGLLLDVRACEPPPAKEDDP